MILPVILAGGSGERLWPLSRTAYPKQFLHLFDAKHSLFQNTIQRLPQNANYLPPLIVCHANHRFIVAEQLRDLELTSSGIILEAQGKNTAPAIALAALWALEHAPDCTLLILPADHLITEVDQLLSNIQAAQTAAHECLVTFGIPATKPETGYGYIEKGPNNTVKKFIEKPDLVTALSFMHNPNYFWNSGMFMFKSELYLQELQTFAPEILACCRNALAASVQDLDFIRIDASAYADCQAISIDYAVMEHTTKAAVYELNCTWSDVGNWHAVWDHGAKDADGNCLSGNVVTHNSSNCMLDARHRLLATINVHDLVIVETSDAVLVADKNHPQEIRTLLSKLKEQTHPAVSEHRKVLRPWGWYDCIAKGAGFQVKLICVQPGKSLSLQSHKFRSEHWIVVNGTAQVVRGSETLLLHANESTFIPLGVKHQLRNFGDIPLEIIEVQSGSYLGEDDIIRYADEHGRAVSTENVA